MPSGPKEEWTSFDLLLACFNDDEPAQAPRQAVLELLARTGHTGPDESGFNQLAFGDGGRAELNPHCLAGLEGSPACAFHLRGLNPDLVRFIYEVARAADMVILPTVEDFHPILVDASQELSLQQGLREYGPVLCGSARELEQMLAGGQAAWER